MRVLAAEDNATNRIILQSMLPALGVEAVIVAGGEEALDRFRPPTASMPCSWISRCPAWTGRNPGRA